MPSVLLGAKMPSVLLGAKMPSVLLGAKMASVLLGAKMPSVLLGAKMAGLLSALEIGMNTLGRRFLSGALPGKTYWDHILRLLPAGIPGREFRLKRSG